jgi:uncharacterized protein (TIGR02453 family)
MNVPFILDFLRDLQRHNSKLWMDANRERYQQARNYFMELVSFALQELKQIDPSLHGVTTQECLFRINKNDFSKSGEAPYKGRMGAGISRGGRHSPYANYILVLEPGGKSRVGGGIPNPKPEHLALIREEIDYNPDELEQILRSPAFVQQFGELRGEKRATAPKGYAKTHASIDLLRHKNFLALRYFSDEEVMRPDVTSELLPTYKCVKPLLDFFNRVISGEHTL